MCEDFLGKIQIPKLKHEVNFLDDLEFTHTDFKKAPADLKVAELNFFWWKIVTCAFHPEERWPAKAALQNINLE